MELTREFTQSLHQQVSELTKQVQALAHRLADKPLHFGPIPAIPLSDLDGPSSEPTLPDAATIRQTIRTLAMRQRYFPADLFADPAWNMLLDLAAAHREGKRVSVTSLCIASGVPSTTALRWINLMVSTGLLNRTIDATDRRRAFVALTDQAVVAMANYFSDLR